MIFDEKMTRGTYFRFLSPDTLTQLEIQGDTQFRFKCIDDCRKESGCCRGTTWLLPEDFSELAKYLHLSNKEFFRKYCNLIYFKMPEMPSGNYLVVLKRDNNGYCILLNSNNKIKDCSVYENRPYVCRTFPVFIEKGYCIRMCSGVQIDDLRAEKGDLYTVDQWTKNNKTIDFYNKSRLIIEKQVKVERRLRQELEKLKKRREFKKATNLERNLNHEIKIEQQNIIMEMFDI